MLILIKGENNMFKEYRTIRGFKFFSFDDAYNAKCSLQESSLVEPHIWLGIQDAEPRIMCQDAVRLGIPTEAPNGWQDYKIPNEVSLTTRMHLNQKQAKELAKKLLFFAKKGHL